jgi:glycosyltransferase involved in cell wall biosynthesis
VRCEMDLHCSVIICSHNPRPDYLGRVLDALKTQTLPQDQWELLLVDNASQHRLSEQWDLSWHCHARHIREGQLGITFARLRAIQESTSDLLVFFDDDNVASENFLEESLRISKEWPMLGAWGGQVIPEFETPAPEWTKPYWPMFSSKSFGIDRWSNQYDGNSTPDGAGLCIRKCVAARYHANVISAPTRVRLGRVGTALLGGEDTDLAFTACDMGMGTGLFSCLSIVHLIKSHRLALDYLLALREAMAYSQVILDSYRSKTCLRKSTARLMLDLIRALQQRGHIRQFRLASIRGEWKARRFLAAPPGCP